MNSGIAQIEFVGKVHSFMGIFLQSECSKKFWLITTYKINLARLLSCIFYLLINITNKYLHSYVHIYYMGLIISHLSHTSCSRQHYLYLHWNLCIFILLGAFCALCQTCQEFYLKLYSLRDTVATLSFNITTYLPMFNKF